MNNHDVEDIYELSPLQQGMLFHAIYEPDSQAYFEQTTAPYYGELDLRTFAVAWQRVAERHTVLRTSFHWEHIDKPVQVVHQNVTIPIDHQDWRNTPRLGQMRRLAAYLEKDRNLRFEISRAPLMRLAVIRLAEYEYRVVWSFHHILLDGWSYQILEEEVWSYYEATSENRDLKLNGVRPYGDYIAWLQQQDLTKAEAYWKRSLKGLLTPTTFSSIYRKNGAEEVLEGEPEYGSYELRLSEPSSAALQELARRHHLTLNTVIQGAWAILLSHYCGEDDVVSGMVVSGRPPTLAGVESMVGLFINTLPVRAQVPPGASLIPWLKSLQLQLLEARQNEFTPMVEIQRWIDLPSRTALFDSLVVFENFPSVKMEEASGEDPQWSGLSSDAAETPPPEGTNYALCLIAMPETALSFRFYYQQRLLSAMTIEQIARHLQTLLENIATNPNRRLGELPCLSAADEVQLLNTWNATERDFPRDRSVSMLFEEQALATPAGTAFICVGRTLSYDELNQRANRLAHHLRALKLGPEMIVAVCLDRSFALTVALLGVWKAGGAYLPLDPSYPKERLAFMLEDSEAAVLVTEKRFSGLFSNMPQTTVFLDIDGGCGTTDGSEENLECLTKPTDLGYIIYTSGSTGRPKGVAVQHEQVLNRLYWMWSVYPFEANEVCCQRTALNFVDSIWELLGPLLRGVPTVIIPNQVLRDAREFVQALAVHRVTRLWMVPSLLEVLLDTHPDLRDCLPALKFWVSSGEPLSARLLEKFQRIMPGCALYNLYGTSEVWDATWYDPSSASDKLIRVPIGRPIFNVKVYVLDSHGRPVPVGVPGELCVGGVGLASRYVNLPELTREKFVASPFQSDARLYRTGDIVRFLPDGNIEFLGRADHQVKIRGVRVELAEIESAISRFHGVRQAVVEARENSAREQRLLAYLVPVSNGNRSQDSQAAETERVTQWREIWNQTFSQSNKDPDDQDDFTGWVSSYTGAAIRVDEMREYFERLAHKILALEPTSLLDIGCGTGAMLSRVAPHVNSYCGTDFSTAALSRLEGRLDLQAGCGVISTRAADDFSGFAPSSFDVIALNSVTQYFPSMDYLMRVIESGLGVLAPGGKIFLGDIRNLLLLEAFHVSVELYRAAPALPLAELRYRVQRRVAEDEQLAVDPAFFLALADRFPQLRHVQVEPKRGRYRNEFTRFRYDVTLCTGEALVNNAEHTWIDWQHAQPGAAVIRKMLMEMPECLSIRRIRNVQFAAEKALVASLTDSRCATVEEWQSSLEDSGGQQDGIDPAVLFSIGDELPYSVQLNWSGPEAPDSYDVVFTGNGSTARPAGRSAAIPVPRPAAGDWCRYANDPLAGMSRGRLVRDLRDFLRSRLPDYMIPSVFSVLPSFPLTPNGKIDRTALPGPEMAISGPEKRYVAPRTGTEEALAHLWQEVLAIGHFGIEDNFFDLGGHSLTATRLLSRLRDFFQIDLPLRAIFDRPTIASLSEFIDEARKRPTGRSMPAIQPVQRGEYAAVVDAAGRLESV